MNYIIIYCQDSLWIASRFVSILYIYIYYKFNFPFNVWFT